jgi:CPA1 family monovalent cation:H+ antiporter
MAETIEIWMGLLVVVVLVTVFSRHVSIPAPILLVAAGLIMSFVPGMANVQLDPELALLVFLPLLVYSSAAIGSWQDLRYNLRIVTLLSVGLVLFTAVGVAAVAHYAIPGMSWPVAFVLGAIVSPPDDVAALAIVKRTPILRRGVTIIEWEGLLNDATALTIFRLAVAATASGMVSLWQAPFYLSAVVVGEVGYGFLSAGPY